MDDRSNDQGFTSTCWSIEEESLDNFWELLPNERRSQWEDDVLGDKLSNKSHRWIIRGFFDVIKHKMNVVELTNEIGQVLWWQLLDDSVVDQLH